LLSVAGLEILLMGQSGLFGWHALTAPFSDYRIGAIQIMFTGGIVLMNVPQLAYFIYMATSSGRDKRDVFAVFCLFATVLIVLYGIASRAYMMAVSKQHQRDLAQVIAKSGTNARHIRFDTSGDDYTHEKEGHAHLPMKANEQTTSQTSSIATRIHISTSVLFSGDDQLLSDRELQAIYNNANANVNEEEEEEEQVQERAATAEQEERAKTSESLASRLRSPSPSSRTSFTEPLSPTLNIPFPSGGSSNEARRQRPISLVIVADEDGYVRPPSVFGDVPPSPRPNMPPPRPPGLEPSTAATATSRAPPVEINIVSNDMDAH